MIVPEIALTPVMMSYYHQRFGEKVAILHSGLTPAEKFDEYRRILRGEVLVVVGARSAIFAPLEKIGLIVLDEEHSETYKQDTPPYYHAREIALWRRQFHQCLLVMGTATPSLESRARAQKGIYQHLMLSKRIFDQSLPTTHIVDMNQTQYLSNQDSIFSQRLLDGIKKRLSTKEQVILLINRRGFAQSIVCRQCEYRFTCPSCQVPLAYHAQINSLKCHYCDHLETLPTQCPSCQGHQLMKEGFGTEKVVSSLQRLFPEANIARLDTDMTGVRSNVTNILKQFQEKKIDILVGTQMVAKGHDFPNVTLVGVMLADLGLHVPHYRATERTFQLIAQVVGRTGRGTQPGEAIIQTTMPNHHAIQLGAKQDYPSFYEREMKDRKLRQYPPFTFLARFELTSRDQNLVDEVALELEQSLKTQLENVAEVIGPNIPYPEFYAGVYRRRILLKYKKYQLLHPILETIYPLLLTKKTVKILFNVDPYDM
jgi:primosomal protein N' (replication factor Y)